MANDWYGCGLVNGHWQKGVGFVYRVFIAVRMTCDTDGTQPVGCVCLFIYLDGSLFIFLVQHISLYVYVES